MFWEMARTNRECKERSESNGTVNPEALTGHESSVRGGFEVLGLYRA